MLFAKTKLGPRHHGRRMSLKKFEFAQVEEGYRYELARGYVIVSEVPNYFHGMQVDSVHFALREYQVTHRDAIHAIWEGNSCKLVIPDWESERHPDLSIYLSPPKGPKNRKLWRTWVPELAIEVVSESSRDRDYTEKRDEYWTLGVKEYWIVDARLEQVLVLRRSRTKWAETTLGPADVCETKLLPEFKLPCRVVFEAAGEERGR